MFCFIKPTFIEFLVKVSSSIVQINSLYPSDKLLRVKYSEFLCCSFINNPRNDFEGLLTTRTSRYDRSLNFVILLSTVLPCLSVLYSYVITWAIHAQNLEHSFSFFLTSLLPIICLMPFQMRLTAEIKAILTKSPSERTNQQLAKVLSFFVGSCLSVASFSHLMYFLYISNIKVCWLQ